MGFLSSICSAISGTIASIDEKKPERTTDATLFKDFDVECKRLQNFDLEAPVESVASPNARAQRRDFGQS